VAEDQHVDPRRQGALGARRAGQQGDLPEGLNRRAAHATARFVTGYSQALPSEVAIGRPTTPPTP